jgi:hypothetical protein
VLWFVAGVLLEVILAMGNDHVVFSEVPISVSEQDTERYHTTSETHSHKINGKVVFSSGLNAQISDSYLTELNLWPKYFSRYK